MTDMNKEHSETIPDIYPDDLNEIKDKLYYHREIERPFTRPPASLLSFIRFATEPDWPLPSRGSVHSAGYDISAYLDTDIMILLPGQIAKIRTGWGVEIPIGYEGQLRPRSGLQIKHGVIGMLGTIDSDYRGEILAGLINLGKEPYIVKKGDRISQLVVNPYLVAMPVETTTPTITERGANGFGSTGK
jgi:dUTP pyrophosphatase